MVSEDHRLYIKRNDDFKFVKPVEVLINEDKMIDDKFNEYSITSVIKYNENKFDTIHCLKVPSEIFLVRRLNSNISFWTGNSNRHG